MSEWQSLAVDVVSGYGNSAYAAGEMISGVGETSTGAGETISCASEMTKSVGETDFLAARRQTGLASSRPALARRFPAARAGEIVSGAVERRARAADRRRRDDFTAGEIVSDARELTSFRCEMTNCEVEKASGGYQLTRCGIGTASVVW